MIYDLIIIGGGINGAGIARDAAGRGLKILLCEQDDLAAHTSSASTKLIHGGLRYLEHYEFGLVRKALQERDILLRIAPHIIHPLRFVMPYTPGLRPAWLIRAGLFLYDYVLYRSQLLPTSETINLRSHITGTPLKPTLDKAFIYSDAWVDDARLVILNARDAADKGAKILTRTKLISAIHKENQWECQLSNNTTVHSKILVNATGPWVGEVLDNVLNLVAKHTVRWVKGSHIITKRLFDHQDAYIFQNPDKRVIFAIPYETDFTLIGTTELEYQGNLSTVKISADEVNYLCESVSQYFNTPVRPHDVIWSYSGVRPLQQEEIDNLSAITRDYKLEFNAENQLLSVFGGKITTYRKLAEEALRILFGNTTKSWTANAVLPGGDINLAEFIKRYANKFPEKLISRYAHLYGSRTELLLASGLGEHIGDDLYEAEVRYLIEHEWAMTIEDILWRRTKLGLHVSADTRKKLEKFLKGLIKNPAAA